MKIFLSDSGFQNIQNLNNVVGVTLLDNNNTNIVTFTNDKIHSIDLYIVILFILLGSILALIVNRPYKQKR